MKFTITASGVLHFMLKELYVFDDTNASCFQKTNKCLGNSLHYMLYI